MEVKMQLHEFSRREFLVAGLIPVSMWATPRPVVSVVRIRNDKVESAVEEAIDLLGGIPAVARGKNRVMLKPNLVSSDPNATTKPAVVKALAQLLKRAGKDVSIGEGAAAVPNFNVKGTEVFRTRKREILDPMQQYVFEQLGYAELAKSLRLPLVNLHSGEMAQVKVPRGFVYDQLTLHRSLVETDLLCSVPMMKTHTLATVTLGMKNLVGLFPGTVYQSIRGHMHDVASKVEPTGASAVVVDMVRANKLGLVVVDGSTAMEGNGPSEGSLVPMGVIVAGTNPLATDMVASSLMGFTPREIPTFAWAVKAGMTPGSLSEIEVRGEPLDKVRRPFAKPTLYAWNDIRALWGAREI
jgi:uncharacterized protein (DUF362 family)